MELKQCTNCEDFHHENEACLPAYTVIECETGTHHKVHGLSHWHAARGHAIKKWIHITDAWELLRQPKIVVDVFDEKSKCEQYILSVEFCAQQVNQ